MHSAALCVGKATESVAWAIGNHPTEPNHVPVPGSRALRGAALAGLASIRRHRQG